MVEPPVTPKAYGGVVVALLAVGAANFGPGLERGTPYGTKPAPPAPLGGGSRSAPQVELIEKLGGRAKASRP